MSRRFSVVTEEQTFELEADNCEVYESKFIRFFDEIDVTETKALSRLFRAAEVVEVRSVKKFGVALFPIERVIMVVPNPLAASGIETEGQDAAERLGAQHESPTAESGDAHNPSPIQEK